MNRFLLIISMLFIFTTNAAAEIKVSYFHNSVRCRTCLKMEKWSKEAVKDINATYESINTDEPQNTHYLKDYGLYTKSVVVSNTNSGKWKNLDKIWQLSGNEDDFKNYIKQEVKMFMKDK